MTTEDVFKLAFKLEKRSANAASKAKEVKERVSLIKRLSDSIYKKYLASQDAGFLSNLLTSIYDTNYNSTISELNEVIEILENLSKGLDQV